MEKLNIPFPIVVEGKYDRLRLLCVCNAQIITTDGFGIFKKNEKLALIRNLGSASPIILLTDSDGAGKLIRSHLTSALPKDRLIQLYIPKIAGKEKRKEKAGKEGLLGVEGMTKDIILNALKKAGGYKEIAIADKNNITPPDDNVRVFYGESYQTACKDYDVVFKSPGIVLDSEVLSYDCEITCQTNVFLEKFSQQIIGITGTKGKTTTSYMIRSIYKAAKLDTGLIGTIRNEIGDEIIPTSRTTPEPYDLFELFRKMANAGCEYVVMEISSHALDQKRICSVEFRTAIFTNLTQDHLNIHKTMENYAECKKILFNMIRPGGKAIINYDDPNKNKFMLDYNKNITYGFTGGDYKIVDYQMSISGSNFTLKYDSVKQNFKVPLIGKYNIYNVLVAISVLNELGINIHELEEMESDAGLGNGGLGRLAACFMDSVASLGLPVHGNCIRYRLGFFDQDIVNGYQVERPDAWLKDTHVWEVRKDSEAVEIPFYGYVEYTYENGKSLCSFKII